MPSDVRGEYIWRDLSVKCARSDYYEGVEVEVVAFQEGGEKQIIIGIISML